MEKANSCIFKKEAAIDKTMLTDICEWIYEEDFSKKSEEEILDCLFDNDAHGAAKAKIMISLCLIIYSNADELFDNSNLRRQLVKFIKDNLQTSKLNKLLKLNNQLNDKEYIDAIQNSLDVFNQEHRNFRVNTNNISEFLNNSQKFFDIITRSLPNNILHTLDDEYDLDKTFFTNFTRLCKQYNNADDFNKVQHSQDLLDIISDKNNKTYRTDYVTKEIINLLNKFKSELLEQLKDEDKFKTTELNLRIDELINRSYAFEENKEITFELEIENVGSSIAKDIEVILTTDDGIRLISTFNNFSLKINDSKTIVFKGICTDKFLTTNEIMLEIQYKWKNHDGTIKDYGIIVELNGQERDIDWDKCKIERPFSTETVDNESDLYGRSEELEKTFYDIVSNQNVFIHGQKRVGKTSFAKVLAEKLKDHNIFVNFISLGGVDKTDTTKFINSLGENILLNFDGSTHNKKNLEENEFNGSLHKLINHFDDLKISNENNKYVIFIDEFDELPADLISNESISDAFFHNLRGLSQLKNVALVFIGGENIQLIKKHTDRFNNFKDRQLDYIQEKYMSDYHDLIKKPSVMNLVTFGDTILDRIYNVTSGNPYFTKLLCASIWARIVHKKELHVGTKELEESINDTIHELDIHNVNYFWHDKMPLINDEYARKLASDRRDFLRYFANSKKADNPGEYEKQSIIDEYESRGILSIDENANMKLRPEIFEKWLLEYGHKQIKDTYADEEIRKEYEELNKSIHVENQEIHELIEDYGLYKGSEITVESVKTWLENFKDNKEKRIFFDLLKSVEFYTETRVREKFITIYEENVRGIKREIKATSDEMVDKKRYKQRRDDILLSSADNLSKSGSFLLKPFADVNKIYHKKIIDLEKISENELNDHNAILFIDDLVASGGQIDEKIKNVLKIDGIKTFLEDKKIIFAHLLADQKAVQKLEEKYSDYPNLSIYYHESISEKNNFYTAIQGNEGSENDEKIIREYCNKLGSRPMGYGEMALTIVFYYSCPNNCLPVLWKKNRKIEGKEFVPLFERSFK